MRSDYRYNKFAVPRWHHSLQVPLCGVARASAAVCSPATAANCLQAVRKFTLFYLRASAANILFVYIYTFAYLVGHNSFLYQIWYIDYLCIFKYWSYIHLHIWLDIILFYIKYEISILSISFFESLFELNIYM